MTAPLPALKASAAALLLARGEGVLASILESAEIEMVGAGEAWSMGSRIVTAHRICLVVDAPAFVRLSVDPAHQETLRQVFALAMRSPDTELADLSIVLRLHAAARPWRSVYRGAPERTTPERPDAEAVLGGAVALCEASGDDAAAAVLRRASLEMADIPGRSEGPLTRLLVRLDPVDLVRTNGDPALAERLRKAVHSAGTRALEPVATVELAVKIRPSGRSVAGPEALLTRALEAAGMTVLPVARDADRVTLATSIHGELRQIEIVDDTAQDVVAGGANIISYTISAAAIRGPEGALAVAAMLSGDEPE